MDDTSTTVRRCKFCREELEPENESRYCSDACENDHADDLRDRDINNRIDRLRGK